VRNTGKSDGGTQMPEQSSLDERLEEIYRWFGQGFEIEVYEPKPGESHYRAVVEEFGLVGEGDTFDAAFDALMERLTTFLSDVLYSAEPLPDRSEGTARQHTASDSGNG
jgi:predicted RNase H-like HicB family nuclease